MTTPDYFDANRRMWNERVSIHEGSEFYDMDGFRAGRNPLHPVEVEEVGDVAGKTLVHLQCHFGQDTLAWARLGARVTGVDLSEEGIATATRIAAELGIEAEFVAANVYGAVKALGGRQFDVVFTGGGALCWLPDTFAWAKVVAALVKPGGSFYIREFHPFAEIFDDEAEDGLRIRYNYFHDDEPLHWDEPGTYADRDAETSANESYEWSHPIGDVVTALAQAGLVIEFLHEFDYSGYKRFPFMVPRSTGERGAGPGEPGGHTYYNESNWVLPEHRRSVPLMYSIRARKPG
jgi:SAM-dependent methyltransferase